MRLFALYEHPDDVIGESYRRLFVELSLEKISVIFHETLLLALFLDGGPKIYEVDLKMVLHLLDLSELVHIPE